MLTGPGSEKRLRSTDLKQHVGYWMSDIHTPAAWDIPPLRLPGHRFPVIVFLMDSELAELLLHYSFCLEFAPEVLLLQLLNT
ncbi:hypothetical protein TNCV_4276751, partial [Trichonephila clavipes]